MTRPKSGNEVPFKPVLDIVVPRLDLEAAKVSISAAMSIPTPILLTGLDLSSVPEAAARFEQAMTTTGKITAAAAKALQEWAEALRPDRRRSKRDLRRAWQARWPQVKRTASRGWRRHIRRQKAKARASHPLRAVYQ